MNGDEKSLHRKNAAEWLMVMAVAPFVLLLRSCDFVASRLRGRKT
jgi:hypothetical protein